MSPKSAMETGTSATMRVSGTSTIQTAKRQIDADGRGGERKHAGLGEQPRRGDQQKTRGIAGARARTRAAHRETS
ncbi:MAG: hypothetical protein WDO56_27710 [Gammaproteobacteria bacterium]